ncbi:hypothetical protein [Pedobacter sp. CFBP9032]|uniref:hypothetical protein n=1 Tax=Pedobacter sp. CFBP9032 TaxID=3096539 RepID=UPI002A6A1E75|nr:hypothetical protein [Pedobacter sp. CFBP9032]MDY0907637.1 hypothetical protein [Pedobacter sp. CFBP9032]
MMKRNTANRFGKGIMFEGIKAVGHGLGIHATKPGIKNTVAKNMRLVDGLMRIAFSPRNTPATKNKRVIELVGIGAIAAYTVFEGIERKNKSLLIQGIFLGTALVAASFASGNWSKRITRQRNNQALASTSSFSIFRR